MKCFLDQAIDLIITSAIKSTPSGLDFRENTYQIPVSVQAQLSAKWIRVGQILIKKDLEFAIRFMSCHNDRIVVFSCQVC